MDNVKKAVFLDRDGTVIIDKHYLKDPDDVELINGAGRALSDMANSGYLIVIISNQSGIGRGMMADSDVRLQHQRLSVILEAFNVHLASIKYCPHAPENHCSCRKPSPKLILDTADELSIDCTGSFMIGDKDSDIIAGKNAGCKTIFIGENNNESATYSVRSISEAVNFLPNLIK